MVEQKDKQELDEENEKSTNNLLGNITAFIVVGIIAYITYVFKYK